MEEPLPSLGGGGGALDQSAGVRVERGNEERVDGGASVRVERATRRGSTEGRGPKVRLSGHTGDRGRAAELDLAGGRG